MTIRIRRRQTLAALAATLCLPARAADWPTGSLTLVVPFSPGGQFDSIAREVARAMSVDLGQTIIVENIGGAGGNIAASKVARARPDGTTLLMYGGNFAVAREMYGTLEYDPDADFVPVSRLTIAPHVVMAARKTQLASFMQMVEQANNGAAFTYGSPGVGSSMHLIFETLKAHFHFDALHVPYKGGTNVMTDLVGGQIDLGIIAVGPALEFIRTGRVIALGVTSKARSPVLPDVPSISELGMAELDAGSWSGLAAPRGTPAAVIARLNQAAKAALQAPEVVHMFERQSFLATPGSPDAMRQFIALEKARFGPLARTLRLQR